MDDKRGSRLRHAGREKRDSGKAAALRGGFAAEKERARA